MDETIGLDCPLCGRGFRVLMAQAGDVVECPHCPAQVDVGQELAKRRKTEPRERPAYEAPKPKPSRSGRVQAVAAAIDRGRQNMRDDRQRADREWRREHGGWVSRSAERTATWGHNWYAAPAVFGTVVGGLVLGDGHLAWGVWLLAMGIAAWLRGGLYRIEAAVKYWRPAEGEEETERQQGGRGQEAIGKRASRG